VLRVWEISIAKTGAYLYSRLLLSRQQRLRLRRLRRARRPVGGAACDLAGRHLAVHPGRGDVPRRPRAAAGGGSDLCGGRAVYLAFVVVYQQIENYVLSPRISARTMELHPAVAFAAVIAAEAIGGVAGAFLGRGQSPNLPLAPGEGGFSSLWGTRTSDRARDQVFPRVRWTCSASAVAVGDPDRQPGETPVFSTLSGDTGPHVSPPDRSRDPSVIMGTVSGFRTSRTGPEGNP
jgi:hypothetical protein